LGRKLKHTDVRAAARNAVVVKYLPMVWKIANEFWAAGPGKRLGTVEDCFQEGVLGLMRAAELFDAAQGCKFITYAHASAWGRMSAMANRKKACWHAVPLDEWDGATDGIGGGPGEQAEAHEATELLGGALRFLPKRWQYVLDRYYVGGLTLEEIAPEMGITKQRVKQIRDGALAKIRAFYGRGMDAKQSRIVATCGPRASQAG
jgi:RNA polymerase sigma factor (sigma-70 family)